MTRKIFFRNKMTGQAVDEVERMRKIAFEKETRFELISELTTYIGYGGLIHQFKNYILRGNERYVDSFNRQYQSAADILARYSKLSDVSDSTLKNIEIIQNTIDDYKEKLAAVIDFKRRGRSIQETDSIVRINDAPAIEALNKLLTEGSFGVDPVYWFNRRTAKINLLKEVEDRLSDDLNLETGGLKNQAQKDLVIFGSITRLL